MSGNVQRRHVAKVLQTWHTEAQLPKRVIEAEATQRPEAVVGPLTVVFTDMGQDFLEWDVNAQGVVTASRPFQSWVWAGMVLLSQPKPGHQVQYRNDVGQVHTIRYPVREVRLGPLAAAAATESP